METNNLRLSQCCGSCIHSSKPKIPYEHCAHYDVPKTQRWCYKNNCHTTRECVCDCYEPITKGGSVSSSKRVFAFNRRLEKILNVIQKMKELNITEIKLADTKSNEHILLKNDRLYYACDCHYSWREPSTHMIMFKGDDTYFDRYENIINQALQKVDEDDK